MKTSLSSNTNSINRKPVKPKAQRRAEAIANTPLGYTYCKGCDTILTNACFHVIKTNGDIKPYGTCGWCRDINQARESLKRDLRTIDKLKDIDEFGCAGPDILGVDDCCQFAADVENFQTLRTKVGPKVFVSVWDYDHDNRRTKTSSVSQMPHGDEKYEREKSCTTLRCTNCHRLKTSYHDENGPKERRVHMVDPDYGEGYEILMDRTNMDGAQPTNLVPAGDACCNRCDKTRKGTCFQMMCLETREITTYDRLWSV